MLCSGKILFTKLTSFFCIKSTILNMIIINSKNYLYLSFSSFSFTFSSIVEVHWKECCQFTAKIIFLIHSWKQSSMSTINLVENIFSAFWRIFTNKDEIKIDFLCNTLWLNNIFLKIHHNISYFSIEKMGAKQNQSSQDNFPLQHISRISLPHQRVVSYYFISSQRPAQLQHLQEYFRINVLSSVSVLR